MKNEADTKHASFVSETASDAIYNSIVRIEIQNKWGTGFFLKRQIQNEFNNPIMRKEIALCLKNMPR